MFGLTKVSVVQCNLQHSRAATATLCRRLDVEQGTLALIQEPWVVKSRISGLNKLTGRIFSTPNTYRPRTAIYTPRHIKTQPLQHLSTSDLTAVEVECVVKGKLTVVVIALVYLPESSATPPPTREMEELVAHCRTQKWELIIACDTNSHHVSWGSEDNNTRGKSLYDYINVNNLCISSRGCVPTFVNSRSQTLIDVTLTTARILM
ncbi:uncharacterized protein LOC111692235 [Anoplophora glabripennis]|uniref:uncharacterized protein LOC111692235 n=1 Tax=Anoplophora glabripennis TaxID=217634 RepID=UPI000C78855E|nr:uncharacterized protein LOC111692235 [Anoplophora glabripennis]